MESPGAEQRPFLPPDQYDRLRTSILLRERRLAESQGQKLSLPTLERMALGRGGGGYQGYPARGGYNAAPRTFGTGTYNTPASAPGRWTPGTTAPPTVRTGDLVFSNPDNVERVHFVDNGTFTQWLSEHLQENDLRCLMTLVPPLRRIMYAFLYDVQRGVKAPDLPGILRKYANTQSDPRGKTEMSLT